MVIISLVLIILLKKENKDLILILSTLFYEKPYIYMNLFINWFVYNKFLTKYIEIKKLILSKIDLFKRFYREK